MIDSEIKTKNKGKIVALLDSAFIKGYKVLDVDLPENWKNNGTTIVIKALNFDGALETIKTTEVSLEAKSSDQIFSPEGDCFYIRYLL